MSVAFPTHVWKKPNIFKHIIVWLFSHMCAFSHTCVSKSKHVWKIAPRCKDTNVFGFFPNMLGKSQTLNFCFFFKFSTLCFHLIKVAECQPFYIYFLGFPLSILFMMPCFQKHSLANSDLYSSKCSPRRCCSLSSLPAKIILSNITVKRSTFLTDHAFEGSIFKPET